MFRIVCDPSSGSIKLYLTEIRIGSLMFVVYLIGVWQRNFEPVVRVYGTAVRDRRTVQQLRRHSRGRGRRAPKRVGVLVILYLGV